MAKNTLIVFDTETGGLKPKENPIMEIALIALDMTSLEEIGRWETLVKNYGDLNYTQGALDVHGISISDAQNNGLSLQEMVTTLIKFFRSFTPKGDRGGGKPILAGHNVPFDIGMLREAFLLAGDNIAKHVLSNGEELILFDTLPMSKFVWPEEETHKLGVCCQRAGMGDFTAHRAMPDVVASCDLIRYFRRLNLGKASSKSVKQAQETVSKDRTPQVSNRKIKFQM